MADEIVITNDEIKVKDGVIVTGTIVSIGYFTFHILGNLLERYIRWKAAINGDVAEYENVVKEYMSKHYAFYGEFQKENQYVKSDSILQCSGGTKLVKFDVLKNHGVVEKDGTPLGTCSVCKANQDICPFSCKMPRVVPGQKSDTLVTIKNCIPTLKRKWSKSKNVVCAYNGYISVVEVPAMTMSRKGFKLLKFHEMNLSTLKGWGLGEFNGDELIGIYPHYVFRISKKTGKWESDGGITFGFGHYVSKTEYETDQEEKDLVDKYAKGAPLIPTTVNNGGVSYKVPGSTYMTMSKVDELLDSDIKVHESDLNNLFKGANYSVTQEQFDALVNLRYHKYKLGDKIDKLISTKSYDKTKWETAIRDLIGTSGDIKRASQLVELFNEGTYPSEII